MILNANDIFKNAFVVSIDNVRLLEFQINLKNRPVIHSYKLDDLITK